MVKSIPAFHTIQKSDDVYRNLIVAYQAKDALTVCCLFGNNHFMNQIGLAMGGMALLWGGTLYVAARPAAQTVTTAPVAFSERFPAEQSLKKQDRLIPIDAVAVTTVDIVDADQINAIDLTAPPEPALAQDELAQDDPAPAHRHRRNERNERNERDERNVCTRHHLRKVWVSSRRWRCR